MVCGPQPWSDWFASGEGCEGVPRELVRDKGVNVGVLIHDMKAELEALAPTNDIDLAAIASALEAASTRWRRPRPGCWRTTKAARAKSLRGQSLT